MDKTTNYNEQYNHMNKKDEEVQFHTVDDILAYYAERHGTKVNNNKEALS
ncbi:hypothetical protein [Paenibacillus dakarensis]|nr:hypothetical protein [Paenibacillus dakarensis]